MSVRPATIEDLLAIRSEQQPFWGERDLSALHHPLLVHEFGETAFVLPGPDGSVTAYLFGLLTPARVAYSHLVAVREGHRREGHARALYGELERVAREHGARAVKAFTRPSNAASIAFHRSIGFTATEVPGYVGPGETRTIFRKALDAAGQPGPRDFERALPGGARMRPVRLGDAGAIHETIEANRGHLARWLPWPAAQTLARTQAFVERSVRGWLAGEDVEAVILGADGSVLGMAGLVISVADGLGTIGYWLAESAQGEGLMTAAVAALVEEAFAGRGLNRVEIRAAQGNERSRAVARRLGFREEATLRRAHRLGARVIDEVVYGLVAEDPRLGS